MTGIENSVIDRLCAWEETIRLADKWSDGKVELRELGEAAIQSGRLGGLARVVAIFANDAPLVMVGRALLEYDRRHHQNVDPTALMSADDFDFLRLTESPQPTSVFREIIAHATDRANQTEES